MNHSTHKIHIPSLEQTADGCALRPVAEHTYAAEGWPLCAAGTVRD